MIDEMPPIKAMHNAYQQFTGLSLPLTMQRVSAWREFLAMGYGADDLKVTVSMLQSKINSGAKTLTCLRFGNLIGNLEWFSEDCAEAKAIARTPKVNHGLNQVLRATGRPTKQEEVKVTVRSAADIIAAEKAFEQFRALKDAL